MIEGAPSCATQRWPSIIFYLVDFIKGAPTFFQNSSSTTAALFGGRIQFLANYRPRSLFTFYITKPSLAFVNHTKAEHPTMARPP